MKKSEVKEGRLPVFKERFNLARGEMSNTEFADFLGISRQTVGFYLNGDRVPDACTLRQIAEKCDVSADWLLGLSDHSRKVTEEMTASDLGLSEHAVAGLYATKYLADQEKRAECFIDGLNLLLGYEDFHMLCGDFALFKRRVEHAWKYEQENEYDGKPLFSKEHPEAIVLAGYDECEYYLDRLKHDFGRIAEKMTGYPRLRLAVFEKRERYFSGQYGDKTMLLEREGEDEQCD